MSTTLSNYISDKRRPQGLSRSSAVTEEQVEVVAEAPAAGKEKLKVVIRLLPADLDEKSFFALIKPWVNDDSTVSKYYVAGHVSKKLGKKEIKSRAYVTMKNEGFLKLFYTAFQTEVIKHFDSTFYYGKKINVR